MWLAEVIGGKPGRRGARTGNLAALGLMLLSGCSLAPDYRRPDLPVPLAYRDTGPWKQARPMDTAPRSAWWTAFDDPTLDALEQQVDTANPTLAAALASYDESRALAAQARASLFPTAVLSDSNTYNRQSAERPLRGSNQPNEYAVNTVGPGAFYEFDFWGRVRNQVSAGEAIAQAAAADVGTARLSLRATLADDYLGLRGLDAQQALLATTVESYRRALKLTQARHDGGAASGLDVSRAATQLASAQAQLSDVAAARAIFEHAIASLVGQPAPTFTVPLAQTPRAIPVIPADLPSTLLQRRPDIAAAERRAFAANRAIGVARAAFYPVVTLDAQGGYQNTGGDNLLIAPNTFWTLGPQVALTVFDGGRLRAGLAAARADYRRESAIYRATVLKAFQDVQDQLALADRLGAEAIQLASAVRSAQATTRLALIRYREGATTYLDVVTAQTAELQIEQVAVNLQTRRQEVSVDLVRALGGGWSTADLPDPRQAASLKVAVSAKPPAN